MPLSRLLTDWFAAICANLDAALEQSPPWDGLPAADRMNHLPELLRAMLRHSMQAGAGDELRSEVLPAACHHGQSRGALGFKEWVVLQEFYLLRKETFQVLRTHLEVPLLEQLLARFDMAVSRASVAALRCMHRHSPDPA